LNDHHTKMKNQTGLYKHDEQINIRLIRLEIILCKKNLINVKSFILIKREKNVKMSVILYKIK